MFYSRVQEFNLMGKKWILIPLLLFVFLIGCLEQKGSIPSIYSFYFENHSDYTIEMTINYTFDNDKPINADYFLIRNSTAKLNLTGKNPEYIILRIDTNSFNTTVYTIKEPPPGRYTIQIFNDGLKQPYEWKTETL